jgi:type II secretory pathway component PulF
MPYYTYIAKPQPDKTIQGEIEAESENDAVNKLTKLGYFPVSIQAMDFSLYNKGFLRLRRVSRREIVVFTRQLSNLVSSGINILNGLSIISRQTTNKYFKVIIDDIIGRIKDGKSLSEAMSLHPDIFSRIYVPLVHAGEVGGNLDNSLQRLADFLEKEEEFKNSLRAALVYPFFILAVGFFTIVVLLTFVIPRLVTMFEDLGQVLPLPTRILISLSNFLRQYWWMILAVVVVCGFLWKRLEQSRQSKIILDKFKLKVFVFGDIILKSEISRLMHTLSLLLSSGIAITSALEISATLLENEVLKIMVLDFRVQIDNGLSLSRCLNEEKLFPPFVANIVSVGEETGTLEKSLLRLSQDYEKEVDDKVKTMTRLLEPVVILFMGLIVGFIVLSMLLPIFQINLITR